MMGFAVGLVISLVILAAIAISAHSNKDEVDRLQELKNKKRFGGKRLSEQESAELDALLRKHWWH